MPMVARVDRTVDRVEEPLATLQPTLERLAETTSPAEVDALVAVIDELPQLTGIVESLSSVAPDLRELLRIVSEIDDLVVKIPGVGRLRRD